MADRYRAYDDFARMYDRHWGENAGRFEEYYGDVLRALPDGARVLDLCCGTGQLTRLLVDRGFEVTGLDGSERMVDYARRNAPGASFQVADARDFRVERPFGLALSTFDSLNHLMTEGDLAAAFLRVAEAVEVGATFAFDLNTETKYLRAWAGDFSVVEPREVGVFRTGVEEAKRLATFDATVFYEEEGGLWSRHDVRLEQTWYAPATVARLLEASGFGPPRIRALQTLADEPDAPLRILFVARRRYPR